jgi:LEA14-like dessication related protein
MRRLTSLFVLACLLAQPVAAKKPQLAPPQITVQALAASRSATPQRFRVTLLIDNLNTEPLVINGLEFKLRLASEGLIDGEAFQPMTIPPLDRQTLTLDVRSDIVSSVSRLQSFTSGPSNSLSYAIYGKITLDRRMKGVLPFSYSGDVPLTLLDER